MKCMEVIQLNTV